MLPFCSPCGTELPSFSTSPLGVGSWVSLEFPFCGKVSDRSACVPLSHGRYSSRQVGMPPVQSQKPVQVGFCARVWHPLPPAARMRIAGLETSYLSNWFPKERVFFQREGHLTPAAVADVLAGAHSDLHRVLAFFQS